MGTFIGIPLSVRCPGGDEACGVGDAAGICIPGMSCVCVCCGDAAGVGADGAAGICMPGMSSVCVRPADGEGEGVRDLAGVCMSCFMFMPRMSLCFGARRVPRLRRTLVPAFVSAFRLDLFFAFGLDMSMPGMFCML
jgi:hypothetical protein